MDVEKIIENPILNWAQVQKKSKANTIPVVVIEENHASIAGQIEETLILDHLIKKFNLRHLILEGMLEENIEVNLQKNFSKEQREDFALSQLHSGEINAAEFFKIIDPNFQLIKGETSESVTFQQKADDKFNLSLLEVLYAIRTHQSSSAGDPAPDISKEKEDFSRNRHALDKLGEDPMHGRENLQKQIDKTMDSYKKYTDALETQIKKGKQENDLLQELTNHSNSIEKNIEALGKIKNLAQNIGDISDQIQQLMRHESFLRARSFASDYMVSQIKNLEAEKDVQLVAMIIGAGHSERVSTLLSEKNYSHIILRPNSLENGIQLNHMQFSIKGKGGSLWMQNKFGLELLLKFKPPTIIQEQWFQKKSALYLTLDRAANYGFGGGNKPIFPT